MMNRKLLHRLRNFININRDLTSRLSSSPFSFHRNQHPFHHFQFTPQHPISSSSVFRHHYLNLSPKIDPDYHFSFATRSHYSTIASAEDSRRQNPKKLGQYVLATFLFLLTHISYIGFRGCLGFL
ncbi:hypothetical protein HanIR_Chr00c01g0903451 [Helianthus annuus]|nr:hypothetical protein HanIR_Chr00c01g0903451 [Helianthus annuus]